LRLLILVAREGFLKDKCDPRAKKIEHHCLTKSQHRAIDSMHKPYVYTLFEKFSIRDCGSFIELKKI